MRGLVEKLEEKIREALKGKEQDLAKNGESGWVVRTIKLTIYLNNDQTAREFLQRLDELMKEYALPNLELKPIVEWYEAETEQYFTEQEIRDMLADYYIDLMQDMKCGNPGDARCIDEWW